MHFTIVSYTFPPSMEIGGRRWAKFSKHLAKSGHDVTVICADNLGTPDWYEKEFPGIEVRVLPKHYPEWLTGNTSSFIEKLLYLFSTRILGPLTKQNLFDTGIAWRKPMLFELENIHRKKPIDVLVTTGAPFSLLYYGAEFKKRHRETQYVCDLRDPWTWGPNYGMPTLPPSKKKFQELSERKAIEGCDMFCYPTKNMGDFIHEKYPEFQSKFYLLPHAYDPEKFPKVTDGEKREGFIYGGSLYLGIEEYIKCLAEIVKLNPGSDFKWDIFTSTSYPLLDSEFIGSRVRKHPLVPEEQLFLKIQQSAAYLAFFPGTEKNYISTKFFEIIYAGTPILYIGDEGEVGKFVRENHLGVHILPENMKTELPQYLTGNVPFKKGYFDVTQFSFSTVTQNFVKALEGLKKIKTH